MARSIAKISKELEKLTDDMKKAAKEYGTASGKEREEMVKKLKEMTKKKKDLEHELERGVMDLDQDVDLQIDEVRKMIRSVIREELKKKTSLNEIEFETDSSTNDPEVDKGVDQLMSKFITGLKADANDIEQTASDEAEIERLSKKYPELSKLTNENKLNEAVGVVLIASILAALPKVIKQIASVIKWASKFSSKTGNSWVEKFASNIDEFGEAWHHGYVKMVEKLLKVIIPGYKDAPHDVQEKIAERVWMAIVAALLVTSGVGALKAAETGNIGMAGLETALANVKRGELAGWLEAELAAAMIKK